MPPFATAGGDDVDWWIAKNYIHAILNTRHAGKYTLIREVEMSQLITNYYRNNSHKVRDPTKTPSGNDKTSVYRIYLLQCDEFRYQPLT